MVWTVGDSWIVIGKVVPCVCIRRLFGIAREVSEPSKVAT
jgi:hypothetical protein